MVVIALLTALYLDSKDWIVYLFSPVSSVAVPKLSTGSGSASRLFSAFWTFVRPYSSISLSSNENDEEVFDSDELSEIIDDVFERDVDLGINCFMEADNSSEFQ